MASISTEPISVIIPTLGRPDALRLCLDTLGKQTLQSREVLIVHCGDDEDTPALARAPQWSAQGLQVRYYQFPERNAARQRDFAIRRASYDNLLLLDDDLEMEPEWTAELFGTIWADGKVAAAMGRLVNQPMPEPTLLWRIYRILLHGPREGLAPGRLVGAALPNGFPLDAVDPMPCEWIGGGCTAMRREAYLEVGGFASFFTGSSPGEDLDLGYRLSRSWKVCYVPAARCIHHQAKANRENTGYHQFLSMRSRFGILHKSMDKSRLVSFFHISAWFLVQNLSELAALRRGGIRPDLPSAWYGRFKGLLSCISWEP
jgi:GT2 family glycosyltransferase